MTGHAVADVIVGVTFVVGGVLAVVAAVGDARTSRLPNALTAAIAAVAVVGFALAAAAAGDGARFVDAVLGAAFFALPWFAVHLVNPAGIGFGDVKLTAGLGFYLGWIDPILSPIAVVASACLFVVVAVATRTARRSTKPFGPALVAGAVSVAVAGLLLA